MPAANSANVSGPPIGRGKPLPRIPADAGADDLDRRHERQRQEHGPQQRKAELGSRLRIGGDAARIVVSRAGHESRPERTPNPARGKSPSVHGLSPRITAPILP